MKAIMYVYVVPCTMAPKPIVKSVSIGFLILTIQCDMSTIMPPGVECVLDG